MSDDGIQATLLGAEAHALHGNGFQSSLWSFLCFSRGQHHPVAHNGSLDDSGLAFSRPVVMLDLLWNFCFISAAIVVLVLSSHEKPYVPLRMWLLGYILQCCVHMACVWIECYYQYHGMVVNSSGRSEGDSGQNPESQETRSFDSTEAVGELLLLGAMGRSGLAAPPTLNPNAGSPSAERSPSDRRGADEQGSRRRSVRHVEAWNTGISFLWWAVGLWLLLGRDYGGSVFKTAPMLSWLCAVFLAFDIFFVIFCLTLALLIGMAVCCCLPCLLSAITVTCEKKHAGASDADIKALPRYRYRKILTGAMLSEGQAMAEGSQKLSVPSEQLFVDVEAQHGIERRLEEDDAECCICLLSYEESEELRELPCRHHFHADCIDQWLRCRSSCPLCKKNIRKHTSA